MAELVPALAQQAHEPPVASGSSAKANERAEIRRDSAGVSEKLRRHAGNVPSLPQTKQCPYCPAKFTRSTHLNRHMKTHSNERLHRCEACQSEFTRSDLLSRHRKTCNGISRARRKSCIPCAESKIKCDLKYPCSKCQLRGKECVIPGTLRSSPPEPSEDGMGSDHDGVQYLPPPSTSDAGPSHSSVWDMPRGEGSVRSGTTDDLSSVLSFHTAESHSSAANLGALYNSDVFDNLFTGLFQQPATPGSNDPGWMSPPAPPLLASAEQPPASQQAPAQPLPLPSQVSAPVAGLETGAPPPVPGSFSDLLFSLGDIATPSARHAPLMDFMGGPAPRVSPSAPGMVIDSIADDADPTEEELANYMYLFFTAFLPQMPLLHAPTWSMEGKPPILLAGMRAGGALYVHTRRASIYILKTLAAAREILISEFGKNPTDATAQAHLVLAVALLQAVGLFHQRAETRASSNIFHGMLVQMIRRRGLITINAAWTVPNLDDPDPEQLEAAWHNWAIHESAKRAMLLSYVHDCCHVIYFGLPASFVTSEFTLNLPCDCALWYANSATEWYHELHQPSVYSISPEWRMLGWPMQKALTALTDERNLNVLTARARINPHAHWILIHTILRNIFSLCPASDPNKIYAEWKRLVRASAERGPNTPNLGPEEDIGGEIIKMQYVLHTWLTSWLACPEVQKWEWPGGGEPSFMCDALPFYWLGQVSIMALQEGLPPFNKPDMGQRTDPDARFRLVKHWLQHCRRFLRNNTTGPTILWDEMMKIRLQGYQADQESGSEDQDGLLGFFPELY